MQATHTAAGNGATGDAAVLFGTTVDYGGVIRTKGVPSRRAASYAASGMGASPSWVVFCIDNAIAFIPAISVAGDLRLRVDSERVRQIDSSLAWGPTSIYNQNGTVSDLCSREALRAVVARAEASGIDVLMGTELEFTLTTRTGERLGAPAWASYGMKSVLQHQAFLVDLVESLEAAGVAPEQVHAEYGVDQFEVSLPPATPVLMADIAVLTKVIIGVVAARHELAASFSPLPFLDSSGNGAHLHLGLSRDGQSLFSGGDLAHGITAAGGAAIAGILEHLPSLLGVYAGSVVSALRLKPGSWSGAAACWGLENREASVRYIAATESNPHGANVELKIVDPSANPYHAATALLGSALDGISRELALPAEVDGDPAASDRAAELQLATDQQRVLASLEASPLALSLFGRNQLDGIVAVRRYEQDHYGTRPNEDTVAALRLAWSC